MGQKGISDKDWGYLIGQKFNRLKVVEIAETGNGVTWCWVECECGTRKKVRINSLRKLKSCGCAQAGKGVKDYNYLFGKKFFHITVLSIDRTENRRTYVNVRCDCGKEYVMRVDGVGVKKCCGCLNIEKTRERFRELYYIDGRGIPGTELHRIYRIYLKMKDRVSNPDCPSFKDYGALGIRMCKEWWDSFISFKDWALSNGYRDDLSIERKNVYCDYCAKNCCWGTDLIQARNKRNTVYLTYRGITKCIAEWAEIVGATDDSFRHRRNKIVKKGWNISLIFEKYENKVTDYIASINSKAG